jgi:hypothetical protein
MKIIIEKSDIENVIRRWDGSSVTVWMYHATFRKMLIRLDSVGKSEALFFIGVGCKTFQGRFDWENSFLEISSSPEGAVFLNDFKAGFSLKCSEIHVLIGPESEFDTDFGGLLGEIAKAS